MPQIITVPIAEIEVERERSDSLESKALLADSIRDLGTLQPVVVRPITPVNGHKYAVVAGRRRIRAHELLGRDEIEVSVQPYTADEAMLAEIDENLCRKELSALERAEATAARIKLREKMFDEEPPPAEEKRKRGRPSTAAGKAVSETASLRGVSRSTAKRDLAVGTIAREARDKIRKTPHAESQSSLLQIAQLPKDQQIKVATILQRAPAKSVGTALAEVEARARKGPKRQWPVHLDHVFGGHRLEMMEKLSGLKRHSAALISYLRKMAKDDEGRMHQVEGVAEDLDRKFGVIWRTLGDWALPVGLCPRCEGQGCDACKMDGWSPEGRLRVIHEKEGIEIKRVI